MKPKTLLLTAVLIFFVSLCRPFLILHVGSTLPNFFFGMKVLGLLVLFLAISRYRKVYGPPVSAGSFGWRVSLYFGIVLILVVYGLLRENDYRLMMFDFWRYLLIGGFLYLGRYKQVWEDLGTPMLILFWIGFLLMVVYAKTPMVQGGRGTSAEAITMDVTDVEHRATVRSVAFRIRFLLHFWPLLFMLGYLRDRWDFRKMAGMATIAAYLAAMIYFQKRAPAGRAVAYAGMIALVVPALQRRLKTGTALLVLLALLAFGAAVTSTISYEHLIARFKGDAPLLQSSRVLEAKSFLMDLHAVEYTVGKGLGGTYRPPPGWYAGTVTVNGVQVRHDFHIGVMGPMLKGGLLFCLLYYSFFLGALRRKPRGWYNLNYNVASMAVLPVLLLFLWAESMPSQARIFDGMLTGMACARMAAPAEEEQWEYEDACAEGYSLDDYAEEGYGYDLEGAYGP